MIALIDKRKLNQESQSQFWEKFGVSQSRASRFEAGAEMPASVEIIVKLYLSGVITDKDLNKMKRLPLEQPPGDDPN